MCIFYEKLVLEVGTGEIVLFFLVNEIHFLVHTLSATSSLH